MESNQTEEQLERNQIGLIGVIMPGLAQVAPAFNLFFTTAVMAGLAGASVPLIFLISMVGVAATANSLAQFVGLPRSVGPNHLPDPVVEPQNLPKLGLWS